MMVQNNNIALKSELDNKGLSIQLPACLKYERTEYAKKIRKAYENGLIRERRCNMRRYTLRQMDCQTQLQRFKKIIIF